MKKLIFFNCLFQFVTSIFIPMKNSRFNFFPKTKICDEYSCRGKINVLLDKKLHVLLEFPRDFERQTIQSICQKLGFDYFNSFVYHCKNEGNFF